MAKGQYSGLNTTVTRKSLKPHKPLQGNRLLGHARSQAAKHGTGNLTPQEEDLRARLKARRERLTKPTVAEE